MMQSRRERIIYTRHDGGVSITQPSANCMRWMGLGGRWADRERGYLDTQIERQIAAGHDERAVVRFCRAMMFGGCTDAEALEIIRDRDCGHLGTAFELVDFADIPQDRWFRNAWRRSHNGGPIYIDMKKARAIQYRRIKSLTRNNILMKLPLWRGRIRRAQTPEQLKSIYPSRFSP